MATTTYDRQEPGHQGGEPEMSFAQNSGWLMFEEDPAVINPDELATFPKQVNMADHYYNNHNLHHGKRTPVRDGRNITHTDTQPKKDGFM